MVLEFDDFNKELAAIRQGVAMADMSPLAKTEVRGADAEQLVQKIVVRDVSKLKPGQVYFTPWCNAEGKVITDGLVFRMSENAFRFTSDPTIEWFKQNAVGLDVEITDVSDNFAILTVQGPSALDLINSVTAQDWSHLDFSRMISTRLSGIDIHVARTGFTGELGYEIHVESEFAASLWDQFYNSGQKFGVIPAGSHACDIARVEAGLLITGCDYANGGPDPSGSHTIAGTDRKYLASPYELNMGHFVDLTKPDFVGKDILAEERKTGPKHKLMGLEVDWRLLAEYIVELGIAPTISPMVGWVPMQLYGENRLIGWASSATWAPTINKLIAFGHLEAEWGQVNRVVEIEWETRAGKTVRAPAKIVRLPFIDIKRQAG